MYKGKYGVYLAPNLVTTAALMFGFYAVLSAINHDFHRSAVCIFVAMLLDGMDGRIARLVGGESAFGEQYDSLSDLLSFGVAPAILMYQWSLSAAEQVPWLPERLSWMIPFVYCACAALRLARFNVQIGNVDARFFIGLPSPSAAGTVAGFVWFGHEYAISGSNVVVFSMLITLFAGLMMVAPIRYYSFKKTNLHGKIPFFSMLFLVLGLAIISTNPATLLWLIFFAYAFHGPVRLCYRFIRAKQLKASS
ncbi:MAG: CDP-diacylglycerol--serine O-phosphatidyltransferase [Gammaproteobacteria bacterium]|nr:MAG: CDP-diacylglycerol--serine O-phosphatidyltransferase [Gammaproteobacteria bacterium]